MLEVYGEAEVLPVGAADAVNPRIDRVVVRLDLTNNERRAYLAVKQGVPAAEPVAPNAGTQHKHLGVVTGPHNGACWGAVS